MGLRRRSRPGVRSWASSRRNSSTPQKAAGLRCSGGPRVLLGAAVSRVLFHRWFPPIPLTGARRAFRRWRPFLWDDRCRSPRAVYPPPCPDRAWRRLFDLARAGVCRAPAVTSGAVGSYSTISPLPDPFRAIGGVLSVALSLAREPRRAGGCYPPACPAVLGLSSEPGKPGPAIALPRSLGVYAGLVGCASWRAANASRCG